MVLGLPLHLLIPFCFHAYPLSVFMQICRKSQEQSSEHHRNMWGNVWPCLGKFYGGFIARIRLKAPGNHSASIWSYNISICSWENPKTFFSMISGLFNVSPSPTIKIIYLLRHQDTLNISMKKSQHIFEQDYLKFQNSGNWAICKFEKKTDAGKSRRFV